MVVRVEKQNKKCFEQLQLVLRLGLDLISNGAAVGGSELEPA
jgi:hypothetical protein